MGSRKIRNPLGVPSRTNFVQLLCVFLALALVPLDDDPRGTGDGIDVRNLQLLVR